VSYVSILLAICAPLANAASNNATVPGTADVWLAGQPGGTVLNGGFPGSDVAPTNSPVLVSTGLNMTAGSYLTFSASGVTDYNGCAGTSPDGGACSFAATASALGISTYNGPANALIGVFLDANTPGGVAPAGMDFSTPGSLSQSTVSPQLNQVFFIGDGRTGLGTGAVQRFVIPAGATRLFLASSDGVGASYNNFGSFAVVVSDAAAPVSDPTAVPTTSPFVLFLTALLVLAAGGYVLESRARARHSSRDPTS
jgi:hypothetical protein